MISLMATHDFSEIEEVAESSRFDTRLALATQQLRVKCLPAHGSKMMI
jgi:hypothetical protein